MISCVKRLCTVFFFFAISRAKTHNSISRFWPFRISKTAHDCTHKTHEGFHRAPGIRTYTNILINTNFIKKYQHEDVWHRSICHTHIGGVEESWNMNIRSYRIQRLQRFFFQIYLNIFLVICIGVQKLGGDESVVPQESKLVSKFKIVSPTS